MKCENCREKLVLYAEGLLKEKEANELAAHLERCRECKTEWEEHKKLHERLLEDGRNLSRAGLDQPVMDRIFREQGVELRELGRRSRMQNLGYITAFAAAAVVLVSAILLFNEMQPTFKGSPENFPVSNPPFEEHTLARSIETAGNGNMIKKTDDWALGNRNKIITDSISQPQVRASNVPQIRENVHVKMVDSLESRSLRYELRSLGYSNSAPPSNPGNASTGLGGTTAMNEIRNKAVNGVELKQLKRRGPLAGRGRKEFGFSVGGAKDIQNFRENIENGFLPAPTDITYEGLFYDYYFDTGDTYRCDDLFYPSYCAAVTRDPFSGRKEYYLTVGLNSGLTSIERKKLNLVVVLDVSGSMKERFDKYSYDSSGNRKNDEPDSRIKIEVAKQSLLAMLDHLNPGDRFGVVIFRDIAHIAKPLSLVGETDMEAIRSHIRSLRADGSTNMSDGMRLGTDLYQGIAEGTDSGEYENRIIFITDAMPNQGELSEKGLLGRLMRNSGDRIYTSVVGVGVDFNSELVEAITKTRGANYLSVHSGEEFEKRMDEEFDFMVTPLVFGLQLNLESGGYRIDKVYGSPLADEANGTLMKVNTLFPSPRREGKTKGGVVLLKLSRKAAPVDDEINLRVRLEDRYGREQISSRTIRFADYEAEHFDSTGIRKAVLLARYANMLKDWLIDERMSEISPDTLAWCGEKDLLITPEWGITVPGRVSPRLGRWERASRQLVVNGEYRKLFARFVTYFENEMENIGDDTLKQEADAIELLLKN